MTGQVTLRSIEHDGLIAIETGERLHPDATPEDIECARRILKRDPVDDTEHDDTTGADSLYNRLTGATLNLRQEFDKPYAMPEFVVNGWIPKGEVSFLAGPGGSGKTTFLVQALVSCAIGRELITGFEPSRKMVVGLLSLEERGAEIVKKIRDTAAGANLSAMETEHVFDGVTILDGRSMSPPMPPLLRVTNGTVSVNADTVTALKAHILLNEIDVLVIDTFSRSYGAAENDSTHAALYIATLESICHTCDCSIVVVHHSGKGRANDSGQYSVRGSSVLSDNSRATLIMQRTPEAVLNKAGIPQAEHFRYSFVHLAKINHGRQGLMIHLRQRDDLFLEAVDLGAQRLDGAVQLLAELLRVQPKPLTERQLVQREEGQAIREALRGKHGTTADDIIKLIDDGVAWGLLDRQKNGKSEFIVPFQPGVERMK